jgi:hypothetical protein
MTHAVQVLLLLALVIAAAKAAGAAANRIGPGGGGRDDCWPSPKKQMRPGPENTHEGREGVEEHESR